MTATTTPAGTVPPPVPAAPQPLVVGLDLSLASTGIAHARGLDVVTDTLRGRGHGVARLRQLAKAIRDHCRTAQLVVIEGPAYHMGTNAGYHERAGLHWMVLERLHLDEVPWAIVTNSQLRKYAGARGTGKGPVVEAATRRYPQVTTGGDDNQTDALWCAALGVDHLTGIRAVPPSHRDVLDGISWPERAA